MPTNLLIRVKNSAIGRTKNAIRTVFKNSATVQSLFFRNAWKARESVDVFEDYFNDENALHRREMLEIIKPINPSTVYEFGCFSAPTLKLLAQNLEHCSLYGSDINPMAIAYAAGKLPDIAFTTADDTSLSHLESWLPERLDVSIISSVFYSMSSRQVAKTLHFLSEKSEFLLIGCNSDNFEGDQDVVHENCIVHPYKKLFSELNMTIHARHASSRKDISLNEFFLLKRA